jgi:hypothetical protein
MANQFPIEAYLQAVQQKRQADEKQGTWASALGGGIGSGIMKGADSQRKMKEDQPAMRSQLFRDLISKNILTDANGEQLDINGVTRQFEYFTQRGQVEPGIGMINIEKTKPQKTALFNKARQDQGLPPFLLGDTGQYVSAVPDNYKLSQMGGQGGSGVANDKEYQTLDKTVKDNYQLMKDINQGIVKGNLAVAQQQYKDAVSRKNKYLKDKYGTEATEYMTQIEGGLDIPGIGKFGGTEVVVPVGGSPSKTKKGQGKLMVDKNGNRAMVYPDGTIEEVK